MEEFHLRIKNSRKRQPFLVEKRDYLPSAHSGFNPSKRRCDNALAEAHSMKGCSHTTSMPESNLWEKDNNRTSGRQLGVGKG
jgi:hypothetical protein